MNRPGQFCIYKGVGAAQINLILPTHNEKGYIEREGTIIIEASSAVGKDDKGLPTYSWGNKISFALGINDLALLMQDIETSLIHDYQGKIKTLKFTAGKDRYEGTYTMNLLQKEDAKQNKIMVPLSAGEMRLFIILMERGCTRMLGW